MQAPTRYKKVNKSKKATLRIAFPKYIEVKLYYTT